MRRVCSFGNQFDIGLEVDDGLLGRQQVLFGWEVAKAIYEFGEAELCLAVSVDMDD